jgi:hypothetical protein
MHLKKHNRTMVRFTIYLFFIVIIPVISFATAGAETLKFRIFTYVTRMESMPIGFVDAPTNVLIERHGYINYEDGDVATFLSRAIGKNSIQKGTRDGYALITYSDDSTSVFEWDLDFWINEITQLKTFSGSGKFIEGTGRFVGINGEVKLTGQEVEPFQGEPAAGAYFDVTATYTLPAK